MKKLLLPILLCLAAGCITQGCATGARTQGDEANNYAANGGTKARGPRVNLGNLLGVSLFAFDGKLVSSVEEPSVVVGASALSKTGLKDFGADVKSQRGTTNLSKTIGYGIAEVTTESQPEAIKAFFAGVGEATAAFMTSGATPAINAIAGSALPAAEKKAAILDLLPATAPADVKKELAK